MARIKDIVEVEKQRPDMAAARVIHLYAEGTFCHAYEWSAWLWQRFVREFKVTHTLFKDIEDSVALIGCPAANLEGSVPTGAELVRIDEKTFDLVLSDSLLPDGYSPELMQKEYEAWKQSLPEAKESNSRKKGHSHTSSPIGLPLPFLRLTDIMRSIIAYDVHRHTPMECVEFLSEIRQKLIMMI